MTITLKATPKDSTSAIATNTSPYLDIIRGKLGIYQPLHDGHLLEVSENILNFKLMALLTVLWLIGAPAQIVLTPEDNRGANLVNATIDPNVVEQTYDAPIATVWKSITDKAQTPQWFFEPIADFDPHVGFATQVTVVFEDIDYVHLWRMTDVVPESRIVYDWRYEGYAGIAIVTWELSETLGGTKLILTQTGHETFPQDNPAFTQEAGVAGWKYLIQESQKTFLEQQT